MRFTRSRLIIVLVSLLASIGLWVLGVSQIQFVSGSSYGTLVFSETVPDREIRRRLERHGFTGMISESGQWFFLDCFDSVEQIPLDEYRMRLLPFDPRNDGYADKLSSLFIQDGKRMVYIPIGFAVSAGYIKKIETALEDIAFSFEYDKRESPRGLLVILFCLASGVFFAVRPLRLMLQSNAACLIPCLPVLAPLSLGGVAGFVLAALLSGFAVSFAELYLELRYLLPKHQTESLAEVSLRSSSRGTSDKMPERSLLRWLLPIIFLACFCLVAFFSGLPVLFTAFALVLFVCIFCLSLWSASYNIAAVSLPVLPPGGLSLSRQDSGGGPQTSGPGSLLLAWRRTSAPRISGHRRFSPITIINRRIAASINFAWALIPYTVVALALAAAGIAAPDTAVAGTSFLPPGDTVTEEEYLDHFIFQSTFSIRSLNASVVTGRPDLSSGMSVYQFTPDGLPELFDAGEHWSNGDVAQGIFQGGVPPFPLGDLAQNLGRTTSDADKDGISPFSGHEILFALLPLLFILPCLIIRLFSGTLIDNSHESVFISSRRTFVRRSHRAT